MNGDFDYYSGGTEVYDEDEPFFDEVSSVPFPPMTTPATAAGGPAPAGPSVGPLPPYMTAAPTPRLPTVPRVTGYPGLDRGLALEEEARNRRADFEFNRALFQNVRIEDTVKAVQAALQFQAMRQFDRDLKKMEAAGFTSEQAAIQAAIRNPRALGGGSAVSSFVRGISRPEPFRLPTTQGDVTGVIAGGRPYFPPRTSFPMAESVVREDVVGGQRVLHNPRTGAFRVIPNELKRSEVSILENEIKQNQAQLSRLTGIPGKTWEAGRKEIQDRIDAAKTRLKELYKEPGGTVRLPPSMAAPPAPTAPTAPTFPSSMAVPSATVPRGTTAIPALPKSKAELVVGRVYQTARGPLRWNGTKLVTP